MDELSKCNLLILLHWLTSENQKLCAGAGLSLLLFLGVAPQRGVRLTSRLRRSARPSLRVTLRMEPGDLAAALQPIVDIGLAGQAGNNADLFARAMGLDLPVTFGDALGAEFDAG